MSEGIVFTETCRMHVTSISECGNPGERSVSMNYLDAQDWRRTHTMNESLHFPVACCPPLGADVEITTTRRIRVLSPAPEKQSTSSSDLQG